MNQTGIKIFTISIVAFLLAGCASSFGGSVSLSPATVQQNIPVHASFVRGKEIYTSTQRSSSVSVHYLGDGLYPAFTLMIRNEHDQPVLLRPEHLSMAVNGSQYPLFSYEEFQHRLRSRGRLAQVLGWTTAAAIWLSSDDPDYEVVQTAVGDVLVRDDNFLEDLASTAAVIAGVATAEAVGQQLHRATEVYLQIPHTMPPQSWYGGTVYGKLPEGRVDNAEVDLYIQIGADLHHFPLLFSH